AVLQEGGDLARLGRAGAADVRAGQDRGDGVGRVVVKRVVLGHRLGPEARVVGLVPDLPVPLADVGGGVPVDAVLDDGLDERLVRRVVLGRALARVAGVAAQRVG